VQEEQEERQRLVLMPRGMVGVEEWFGGFQQQQGSLSLLPCQSVTPSYDPGESVFVCVFLSLPLLSLSTGQHQQTTTTTTTTTAISFSLSIYSFVCPLSLSPRISHLLASMP